MTPLNPLCPLYAVSNFWQRIKYACLI